MSRRCALIGVEGNHDQAFISRVLQKFLGFQEFKDSKEELDNLWRKIIPRYPPKSGKLYVRLDMPSILNKDNLSIAVYAGEGSKLIENLTAKLSDIDATNLDSFGIIADADDRNPAEVARNYYNGFREMFPEFPQSVSDQGAIAGNFPKLGLYILPNNTDRGTLETLLCKCGKIAYPEYMARAEDYISKVSEIEIKKHKWKIFGREKAIVASIASVLEPGSTNTVSIKQNDWVSKDTENLLHYLICFLKTLLNNPCQR